MDNLKPKNKLKDYKKIFISHYGKIASNTLAESIAEATKEKRTSIKSDRHYDEFILTTGLNHIVQINHTDKKTKKQVNEKGKEKAAKDKEGAALAKDKEGVALAKGKESKEVKKFLSFVKKLTTSF